MFSYLTTAHWLTIHGLIRDAAEGMLLWLGFQL